MIFVTLRGGRTPTTRNSQKYVRNNPEIASLGRKPRRSLPDRKRGCERLGPLGGFHLGALQLVRLRDCPVHGPPGDTDSLFAQGILAGTLRGRLVLCRGSLDVFSRRVFREFRQMLVVRAPVAIPHQSILYSVAPTASTTWSPTLVLAALSALW